MPGENGGAVVRFRSSLDTEPVLFPGHEFTPGRPVYVNPVPDSHQRTRRCTPSQVLRCQSVQEAVAGEEQRREIVHTFKMPTARPG